MATTAHYYAIMEHDKTKENTHKTGIHQIGFLP